MMKGRSTKLLTLLCATLALGAPPVQAAAQQGTDEVPLAWRRWALGLAAGAALATVANSASEGSEGSVCSSSSCLIPVGGLLGFGLGFLLGNEMDQKALRIAREGPTIELPFESFELPGTAVSAVGTPGGVLALSRDDVTLVRPDGTVTRVPALLQPRTAGFLVSQGAVLVAENGSVVAVPTSGGPPDTLLPRGAGSLAVLADRDFALGEPGWVRILRLEGSAGSWSAVERSSVQSQGIAAAMRAGPSGALWSLTDSVVTAFSETDLRELGSVRVPGRGRALSVTANTALVSLGADGVAVIDLADRTRPRVAEVVSGMEFAYGSVLVGSRMFVAAGPQGVFVFDRGATGWTRTGVIRDFDFAADVVLSAGALYVLDRGRGELKRSEVGS